MANRKQERRTDPDLSPERAIAALEKQLQTLQALRGRSAREVESVEQEWFLSTEAIVACTFGDPSRNLSNLHSAKWAGRHSVMGISETQHQENFRKRTQRYEGFLRSCIAELELGLPADTGQNGGAGSVTDSLLGIFVRGQFDRKLLQLTAAPNLGLPLSLLVADLDDFKSINDSYGHEAGDEVLKRVATAIASVASGKGQCYRYGGDEITVLLQNYSAAEAFALAERILHAVQALSFEAYPGRVGLSIGVASFPETTGNAGNLFKDADRAMYDAKNAGGSQVLAAGTLTDTKQVTTSNSRPRAAASVEARVAAVKLSMRLNQAVSMGYIMLVQNRSEEEVEIEEVVLKRNDVRLCDPIQPKRSADWKIAPGSGKQIDFAPMPNPVHTLYMTEPSLGPGTPIGIDLVVSFRVLGISRSIQQRVLVTVDFLNHQMTQVGG